MVELIKGKGSKNTMHVIGNLKTTVGKGSNRIFELENAICLLQEQDKRPKNSASSRREKYVTCEARVEPRKCTKAIEDQLVKMVPRFTSWNI